MPTSSIEFETLSPRTLWRISTHETLDGVGGVIADARWNTRGHRIVYLAESPASAMLEILAHLPIAEFRFPDYYRLLRVEVSSQLGLETLDLTAKNSWRTNELMTRQLGDAWLESAASALARVPSALVPHTWNYLLNPVHPDAAQVQIAGASDHLYDPRLLRVK